MSEDDCVRWCDILISAGSRRFLLIYSDTGIFFLVKFSGSALGWLSPHTTSLNCDEWRWCLYHLRRSHGHHIDTAEDR